jgi:hypothetical protein
MARQLDPSPKYNVDIWQVDNDVNGNPRYVVHYTAAPYTPTPDASVLSRINAHIAHAKQVFHGHIYRASWFGGGIVIQTYQKIQTYIDECIDEAKEQYNGTETS